MLFAIDFHEDFIDKESIAVTAMLALQSLRVESTELDAPEPDGLIADCDATLSKEIFYIPVAEIEAIVEPDGIADDIGRESVTLVDIHWLILPSTAS